MQSGILDALTKKRLPAQEKRFIVARMHHRATSLSLLLALQSLLLRR
jgi:hypothetical protein